MTSDLRRQARQARQARQKELRVEYQQRIHEAKEASDRKWRAESEQRREAEVRQQRLNVATWRERIRMSTRFVHHVPFDPAWNQIAVCGALIGISAAPGPFLGRRVYPNGSDEWGLEATFCPDLVSCPWCQRGVPFEWAPTLDLLFALDGGESAAGPGDLGRL